MSDERGAMSDERGAMNDFLFITHRSSLIAHPRRFKRMHMSEKSLLGRMKGVKQCLHGS
jgi:hypothetical protein